MLTKAAFGWPGIWTIPTTRRANADPKSDEIVAGAQRYDGDAKPVMNMVVIASKVSINMVSWTLMRCRLMKVSIDSPTHVWREYHVNG